MHKSSVEKNRRFGLVRFGSGSAKNSWFGRFLVYTVYLCSVCTSFYYYHCNNHKIPCGVDSSSTATFFVTAFFSGHGDRRFSLRLVGVVSTKVDVGPM